MVRSTIKGMVLMLVVRMFAQIVIPMVLAQTDLKKYLTTSTPMVPIAVVINAVK